MSVWVRRAFSSQGLTQYPPGPYTPTFGSRRLLVTTPGYDDIGRVLASMGLEFEPFDGAYDGGYLFLNCGSSDASRMAPEAVAGFVADGGCLYASDLAAAFLQRTFPQYFEFSSETGGTQTVEASVVDPELRAIVGESISVGFDMGGWRMLERFTGDAILTGAPAGRRRQVDLMVRVAHGRGSVFYTSFHNRAQASEQEVGLLQLLLLKQIGQGSRLSVEQASLSVGVDIEEIKRTFLIRGKSPTTPDPVEDFQP